MTGSAGRITLWGVEVFVATAEERSITAAARRLGASASAVSQQLTNLEGALGVTLLERSARPVQLTPEGEIFRRRAQSILNEAEQAKAELERGNLQALPRLRLGMIEDFELDVTPKLLTELAGEFKTCEFLLETGASHVLLDQLEARALDVAVCAEMGPAAEALEVHPLLEDGFVVAAPKGAVDRDADILSQLERLPLVHYSARHFMGRLIARHLSAQRLRLAHRFELDSYLAIMALVAQGAGWTILTPLALMRAQRFAGSVDVFALPFEPLSRRISLFARNGALQDMPAQIAGRLTPILRETVVRPAHDAFPAARGAISLL